MTLHDDPSNTPRVSDQNCLTEDVHRVAFEASRVASCRSYYGSSAAKIREVVNQSSNPLTPLEVSQITGLKHSTVKKTLYRLERKGFVKKSCYGCYQRLGDNATLKSSMVGGEGGVSVTRNVVEPRLHCIRLRVSGVVGGACERRLVLGLVEVLLTVHRNGTATVFVDCRERDYSFDYVCFRMLIEVVLRELGVSDWGKVTVSSFEFNHDFEGVRLDGCQAVTLKSFDGSFRRVYNKKRGLRDEVKVVGPRRVEDVLALLQGGVSQYNLLQLLFVSLQRMGEFVEVARGDRKLFHDAVSSMRRLADAALKARPLDSLPSRAKVDWGRG